MKRMIMVCWVASLLAIAGAVHADDSGIGVRFGLGTDISGGTAFGLGINRLMAVDKDSGIEIGGVFYTATSTEESSSGSPCCSYKETTDVRVFGVLANYLGNYRPNEGGFFYLAGIGVGVINVSWEEASPNDVTLGTRVGGGSKQSEEGTVGGTILNLGLGVSLGRKFDIRLEAPIFFIFGAPGDAAGVIPTLTLTAGLRF